MEIMIMISQFNIVVLSIALISILSFAMIGNYHRDLVLIYAQQTLDSDPIDNNTIN